MDSVLMIAYSSFGSILIPIFIGLPQIKKLTFALKGLLILCFASFLADVICLTLMKNAVNNWIVLNVFSIIQITIFLVILNSELKIKLGNAGLILLSFASIISLFYLGSNNSFNYVTSYVGGLILILLCLIFLYRLLIDLPTVDIFHYPILWIVFAILIYYGGTLFLFLFNNYLLSINIVSHKSIWILHNTLNIIKNLLFALALWQHYRKVRLSH
ncbi:MAG: hypothetical protein HYZ44_02850 [Bacteroidetes bacterium]|nr:hypothetical protein [Bacteroidota bacterium]